MGLPMFEQRLDEMIRETCYKCGVMFCFTQFYHDMRLREKDNFYCPNGHPQCYMENEADGLRKQLEQANRAKQIAQDTARMEAEQRQKAEAKLDRINNGVCPKCNRQFKQLARHMQSKHGVKCNQTPKAKLTRAEKSLIKQAEAAQ